MKQAGAFLRRILGASAWRPDWQAELSETLNRAQKGLGVSMVVVIARESDLYAEVLYLLSFVGLAIGTSVAFFMQDSFQTVSDALAAPLLGFSVGSTLFAFRRFFINRIAPRAIRDRVANRAKSIFHDHEQHVNGKLALLYFSEMESEALFLSSQELVEQMPTQAVQAILSQLAIKYRSNKPMEELRPALLELGNALRRSFASDEPPMMLAPIYVAGADRPISFRIPILKGSKDIN